MASDLMTPETVHFLAGIIRQQRGILTMCDRWVRKQPWSWSDDGREMIRRIEGYRVSLTELEDWLSKRRITT